MTMLCPRCWAPRGPCDGCNGTGKVPDVRLSDWFTLAELVRSDKAQEFGIANAPTPRQSANLVDLCQHLLDRVRERFGPLLVTSGLRVEKLNRVVGGSSTSAHVVGWAADVQPLLAPLDEVMNWLARSDLRFDQAIREPSWIHLGYKRPSSGEQRQEVKRALGGNKYEPWVIVSPEFTPSTQEKDRCRLR